MSDMINAAFSRRDFVQGAVSSAALAAAPALVFGAATANPDKAAVLGQVPKMHAENIKRLQDWIALPSIAAENRNFPARAPSTWRSSRSDAGFTGVKLIPTSGKPGVFGKLDAGARTTMALYFMYDVKQFVPEEWSSPPLEGAAGAEGRAWERCAWDAARSIKRDRENSLLSALMAFKAAGKKLPVNFVLVCEGEEEIASPHFQEVVKRSRGDGGTQEMRRRIHARSRPGSRRRRCKSRWVPRAWSSWS